MKKTLLEVYALIICGITLIWSTVSIGIISYATIRINYPELTLSEYEFGKFQSNERYLQSKRSCNDNKVETKLNEEELTKQRLKELENEFTGEKRSALQDIIKQTMSLFVCIIMFFIHWKLAKKSRA